MLGLVLSRAFPRLFLSTSCLITPDAGFGERLSLQLLWFYAVVQLNPSANTLLGGLTGTRLEAQLVHGEQRRGLLQQPEARAPVCTRLQG